MKSLPIPQIKADSRPYWDAAAKDELKLQRCSRCTAFQSIPRSHCADCHCEQLQWLTVPRQGTVVSFSIVHRGPSKAFKDDVPYVLALVDLEVGARLMLNIRGDDRERVAIGDAVEIFFEARGDEGFKIPQARRKVDI